VTLFAEADQDCPQIWLVASFLLWLYEISAALNILLEANCTSLGVRMARL